jgi:hypothetical protein
MPKIVTRLSDYPYSSTFLLFFLLHMPKSVTRLSDYPSFVTKNDTQVPGIPFA